MVDTYSGPAQRRGRRSKAPGELLVPPGDAPAAASRLLSLAADESLRERLTAVHFAPCQRDCPGGPVPPGPVPPPDPVPPPGPLPGEPTGLPVVVCGAEGLPGLGVTEGLPGFGGSGGTGLPGGAGAGFGRGARTGGPSLAGCRGTAEPDRLSPRGFWSARSPSSCCEAAAFVFRVFSWASTPTGGAAGAADTAWGSCWDESPPSVPEDRQPTITSRGTRIAIARLPQSQGRPRGFHSAPFAGSTSSAGASRFSASVLGCRPSSMCATSDWLESSLAARSSWLSPSPARRTATRRPKISPPSVILLPLISVEAATTRVSHGSRGRRSGGRIANRETAPAHGSGAKRAE